MGRDIIEPVSLLTVGYEGRNISEFIDNLLNKKVRTLIDVREIPASRKFGFSKNQLLGHLEEVGIKYIHIKDLGSPKTLREKLRENNDFDSFFKKYSAYIQTRLDIVKKIYEDIIMHEKSCIMCFERNPSQCHRKIVAEKVKEIDGNGLVITHI
ncbi:MAG: DUF488 domain-containing protein [Nitrospiraceae bacterium]|nr:DUF488 domain-containing protein [Nitrospiraceae bacterium]